MNCYTYMVQCSDGTLYTGWTNDLKKRLEKHNAGKGARYTRGRLPVKLVYYEEDNIWFHRIGCIDGFSIMSER